MLLFLFIIAFIFSFFIMGVCMILAFACAKNLFGWIFYAIGGLAQIGFNIVHGSEVAGWGLIPPLLWGITAFLLILTLVAMIKRRKPPKYKCKRGPDYEYHHSRII